MTPKQKINIALMELRKDHPFLGVLSSFLKISECPKEYEQKFETMAVSKNGSCVYNRNYVEKCNLFALMSSIAHEALHPAFNVWNRIPSGDHELKNIAHDYVINLMLANDGLKIPKWFLLDYKYRGQSFEEVYDEIANSAENIRLEMKDFGEDDNDHLIDQICGNIVTINEHGTEVGKANWEQALYMADEADRQEASGKFKGNLTSEFKLMVDAYAKPPVKYKKLIRRAFSNCGRKIVPSYFKRNKLNSFQKNSGFFAGSKTYGLNCYILVDSSGSMFQATNHQLKSAYTMIKSMATNCSMNVQVIVCDTHVKWTGTAVEFEKDMKTRKGFGGGGGSDFKPAFEWIWNDARNKVGISPIFAFTDGEITVHEQPAIKKCPTYWLTDQREKAPTKNWGSHIVIPKVA